MKRSPGIQRKLILESIDAEIGETEKTSDEHVMTAQTQAAMDEKPQDNTQYVPSDKTHKSMTPWRTLSSQLLLKTHPRTL